MYYFKFSVLVGSERLRCRLFVLECENGVEAGLPAESLDQPPGLPHGVRRTQPGVHREPSAVRPLRVTLDRRLDLKHSAGSPYRKSTHF